MATAYHARTPSHSKRARPSRPGMPKRNSSYSKSQLLGAPRKEEEEDDAMAASFLNYCTVCEKQIIVPNNSILYCSESCRKKDHTKPISFDYYSPPQTPYTQYSFDELVSHPILSPRSPTSLPSKRLSYGFSEASDDEADWVDEKPKVSEATRYLRASADTTSARRPSYKRSTSSTPVPPNNRTPSLSHSPGSTASVSVPFTPNSRPLPSRTNPNYSKRSVDLVNPFAVQPVTAPSSFSQFYSLKSMPSCQTSTGIAEGEMQMYKRTSLPSPGQGSLKELFAFSAMQAPPTSTASTMRPGW